MPAYVRCTTCGRELGSNDPRTDEYAYPGESLGDLLARLARAGVQVTGSATDTEITCQRCRLTRDGELPRPVRT